MPAAEVVQRLLEIDDEGERRDLLQNTLPSVDADEFLSSLKAEAERQWTVSPHASLRIAEALIEGAQLSGEPKHHALGLMAKADALRYLGRYSESLLFFECSANSFLSQKDEVGWART